MSKAKRLLRRLIGDPVVRRIKASRRRAAESVGIRRWSRPGLNGLDERLAEQIDWVKGGYFIELGANDGLQQSNTYLLEHELDWTGLLIEAIPQLANEAARNRPNCTVVCAAVSGPDQLGHPIALNYHDLTSTIGTGTRLTATTTLSILWADLVPDDAAPTLISLDVEGHELSVLAGLDLDAHRPDWMLIETAQVDEVTEMLGAAYELVETLSYHDYLFRRI